MKKFIFNFTGILILITNSFISIAQSFSIEIIIKNQPNNPIILEKVEGDNFTPIDSAFAEKNLVRFTLPENTNIGIYRLVFGQTTLAKVMNEAPQQLDFIFNNENIVFESDFNAPTNSLNIIQSLENKVWVGFLKMNNNLKQQLSELEKEVNYFWLKDDTNNAVQKATEYNQLQIKRDLFITQMIKENEGLFATRLIKTFREPMLDGYLTELERQELFKKEYFKSVDFTDETLIHSQAYTDKVFNYLVSYNQKGLTQEQRVQEYIKAVDVILSNTNKNEKVYVFIQEYLIHGFEVLKLKSAIDYIRKNYSSTTE